MKSNDISRFDGKDLHSTRHYEWPEPHSEEFHLRSVPFDDPSCAYWCAANGQIFTLAVLAGDTCIANVENMLSEALPCSYGLVYVIWKPKTHTPAVFNRWVKKWTARTSPTVD